jgi:glycosyltransferase involved in cell wall biosynthesis
MRRSICLCISQFYPVFSGAERQAFLQGAELVRRGHRVHVITTVVPGEPTHANLEGIEVHRVARFIRLGPLFGLTLLRSLSAALVRRRQEFDLVHTHQAMWEACATGLVRKRLGRPVLVQPAASGYYGEQQALDRTRGRRLLRRLVRRNTHFAAISDEITEELTARGVEPARITRMDSGVDVNEFRPATPDDDRKAPLRNLDPGGPDWSHQPIVVFAGRLHPQKNLRGLLDAWARVAREETAHLLLLGDGPDRHELQQQVERLGCTSSVRFAGRIHDVALWLRAADAFVLPSLSEGSSNSLLEGMATGLPCLVSRIGGNVDMVRHDETGLVIDPHDTEGWHRALLAVVRDRPLAHRLGAAARRWVTAHRSIPAVVTRYEELYDRLLSEGQPVRNR